MSLEPSPIRYSPYFWLMKSNIASAVGNLTDWAMRLILSAGMPAFTMDFSIPANVSCKLRISGSAMSIAKRESLVRSFSTRALVFAWVRKVSTIFVPAEPIPIT